MATLLLRLPPRFLELVGQKPCAAIARLSYVVHKIGYGGYSTVWLCYDIQESKYLAVKILTSDVPLDSLPDLHRQKHQHSHGSLLGGGTNGISLSCLILLYIY